MADRLKSTTIAPLHGATDGTVRHRVKYTDRDAPPETARMRQPFRSLLAPLLCLLASPLLADAISPAPATEAGTSKHASATPLQAVANDSFSALDRNQDGRLSRSEAGFDALLSQTFAIIDTDGDGFVTPEEFAAAQRRTSLGDTAR